MELLKEYISLLVEGQQKIMFHGTSDKFLQSIMKQGIVAEPRKKTWDRDKDKDINWNRPSLASVGGSYWTSNFMTALGAARNAKERFGGGRIIVIAQLSLNTSFADEDSIVGTLQGSMQNAFRDFGINVSSTLYFRGYWDALEDSEKNELINDASQRIHKYFIQSNPHIPFDSNLLKKHFFAWLNRVTALTAQNTTDKWEYIRGFERGFRGERSELPTELPSFMSTSQAEREYSEILDKMTRKYKESARDPDYFNQTLRMTTDIGFSGKNKIICIIKIRHNNILLIYGKIPPEFVSAYEKGWGEFPEVTSLQKTQMA